MQILVLNVGSSSLKASLYALDREQLPAVAPSPAWALDVDWSRGQAAAAAEVRTAGARLRREVSAHGPGELLEPLLATAWSGETHVVEGPAAIDVVGHRVVHGGATLRESALVTPAVAETIRGLAAFAPAHNPVEHEAIEAAAAIFGPATPQVAVFDTAFHASLAPAAYVYGGPYAWVEQGLRRYGFHGISHQYVARRAAQVLGRPLAALRLVSCHLGSGCSLAAIRGGQSVDTTMGFTPLDGLIMGTRSGAVDPGLLLYLLRQSSQDAEQLDRLLNRESGLKGLSGGSGDMREIESARAAGDVRARLAFDAFAHRVRSGIAAMAASAGGLDALVFTAGIGERSAAVRTAVCGGLAFLGVALDEARNAQPAVDTDIAGADAPVRVLVVHTQEDWEIARECHRLATSGKLS